MSRANKQVEVGEEVNMETDEYELDYETDDGAASPPRQPRSQAPPTLASDQVVDESSGASSDSSTERDADNTDKNGVERVSKGGPRRQRAAGSASASVGRKRPLKSDGKVAILTRKLAHYKKLTSELRNQLQKLYEDDAIAFLENKAQEKQRQIDTLAQENRSLQIQQRALLKQVEELQESMEQLPATRASEKEELRICREQLRIHKDRQRKSDEKETKLHKQVVDLTLQNKALLERIKELQDHSATTPKTSRSMVNEEMTAIIESQEDAITRLQHRVDVMKKASKLDKAKHDKVAQSAQEELETARADLDNFQHRVLDKEKLSRSQVLELKQLKRALREVVRHMQMNQQLNHASGGRDMRFANQHQRFPVSNHGKATIDWDPSAQVLLSRLGATQLQSSTSKASFVCLSPSASSSTAPKADTAPTHHICHAPCPPPLSHAKQKTPRRSRGHITRVARRASKATDSGAPEDVRYEDVDPVSFESIDRPDNAVDQRSHRHDKEES